MSDPWVGTWTADDCAAEWGCKPTTWLSYVSRGKAPAHLDGYDEQRRRRWDPDTVRAAKAARRGQAWRAGQRAQPPEPEAEESKP